jgi:hypothetical protein
MVWPIGENDDCLFLTQTLPHVFNDLTQLFPSFNWDPCQHLDVAAEENEIFIALSHYKDLDHVALKSKSGISEFSAPKEQGIGELRAFWTVY